MTKIAVIGNVCVDLIAEVSKSFLTEHGLAKSVCTTITPVQNDQLLSACNYTVYPGGCGANTAAAMGLLGLDIDFVGAFGPDTHGALVQKSLSEAGVTCHGFLSGNLPAQTVFTFITPDGDRTFACFYDGRTCIDPEIIVRVSSQSEYVVLDGYSLLFKRTMEHLIKLSSDPTMTQKIVFCPNDISVIDIAPEAVHKLYNNALYTVLNDKEYETLFPSQNIVKLLNNNKKYGAVTHGAEGATLYDQTRSITLPSLVHNGRIVNSNGAGDAFTAGYLYGLVHNWTLEQTGHMAALCAAAVLDRAEAQLRRDDAARIIKEMAEFH